MRERGLKSTEYGQFESGRCVAPVRERGLKYLSTYQYIFRNIRRSREGAWIEIGHPVRRTETPAVAPVRERGLKYIHAQIFLF